MTQRLLTKQDVEEALEAHRRAGRIRGFGDVEEQADGSVTYLVGLRPPLVALNLPAGAVARLSLLGLPR